MRLNFDCMRKIIEICVENLDYQEFDCDYWREIYVSLFDLYNHDKLKKFEKKDIMYSVMKLTECKYIKTCDVFPEDKDYFERCTICDITIQGYNFYNAIKDDNIWSKTKHLLGKIGNHTLKFVEETAHDVAVETAKEIIKGGIL